jgi:hypothetical protein
MTVANAKATWAAAGFTGPFSPAGKGRDAWIVDTQSPAKGACVAPSSTMTITAHKP